MPDPELTRTVEVCRCGHPLDVHTGTGVSGLPCKLCGIAWRRDWPSNCTGWDPASNDPPVALSYGCTCPGGNTHDPNNPGCRYGQVAAVRPPDPAPDPAPDLVQAIQAASAALFAHSHWKLGSDDVARIAVKAIWPRSALAELAALRHANTLLRDLTREQDQALQATRDRLAETRGALAELFDLLHVLTLSPAERASVNVRDPRIIEARVRAALQDNR